MRQAVAARLDRSHCWCSVPEAARLFGGLGEEDLGGLGPDEWLSALVEARPQAARNTLFTGFMPAGMRGEMRSFQVLPAP